MVDGSIHNLLNSRGMFGSSYVNVSIGMCAITCVSRQKPMYGVRFWQYQLLSRIVIIVMILGSFFVASLT